MARDHSKLTIDKDGDNKAELLNAAAYLPNLPVAVNARVITT
jgi:hypothetical protein